jgi:hypothetical protein
LRPGGSPAGLDRTRRKFSPDGGRRNLSPPSIPASECGGEAFSPGKSSPAGPLSFLGLSPGGLNSHLFQNLKGDPCLFYFGLIYNLYLKKEREKIGSFIHFRPINPLFLTRAGSDSSQGTQDGSPFNKIVAPQSLKAVRVSWIRSPLRNRAIEREETSKKGV